MTLEQIKESLTDKVEFKIDILPEYTSPIGYFASGDDAMDKEYETKILQDVEWNQWAWCQVRVTASWGDFTGTDCLGACSYENEAEFKSDGYWEDMKNEALNELAKAILKANQAIEELRS